MVLHLLFLWMVWQAMRPAVPMPEPERWHEALQMRLIAPQSPALTRVPPDVPRPPAPHAQTHAVSPPRPVKPEPPAKDAMTIQLPATPAPLYDADGLPRLPASSASAPTPGYVQHKPQGDTQIMQHHDPIKYQSTRFNEYFPPADETAGGAAVRHVVDAVIDTKNVDLPRGVHLKCLTVLGIPIPDCINPPPRPSYKDGDERLSMAPAKSLDGYAHADKPPSVEACIAMYRANKPLAWGCPMDTPNRSVDAEMKARAEKAAAATRKP